MKGSSNIAEPEFKFWAYLAADIRRYRTLVEGATSDTTSLAFIWYMVNPRIIPVINYRLSYLFTRLGLRIFARIMSLFNQVIFGLEIAIYCRIGPGLILPHTYGTVIGAFSIGNNATIFQGVTLGAKGVAPGYSTADRPVVGDNVLIGSGAKIIGNIVIGNNVKIGANAVVLMSIPDGAVAVGVPATFSQAK